MLTNLCIRKHGNRFKRPQNPQKEFLSLQQYLDLARYGILKFAGPIAHEMSKSDDAISFVAEKVMLNDWQMNNEKNYSRLAIRIRVIKWSILEYIKLGCREHYTIAFSALGIGHHSDNWDAYESVLSFLAQKEFNSKIRQLSYDKYLSDIETFDSADETNIFRDKFERLIYLACLSPQQETCIRLKFKENMAEAEIATELRISKQAVNLYLQNAYFKLREVA